MIEKIPQNSTENPSGYTLQGFLYHHAISPSDFSSIIRRPNEAFPSRAACSRLHIFCLLFCAIKLDQKTIFLFIFPFSRRCFFVVYQGKAKNNFWKAKGSLNGVGLGRYLHFVVVYFVYIGIETGNARKCKQKCNSPSMFLSNFARIHRGHVIADKKTNQF